MDATIDYLSSHNVRLLKEGELQVRDSSNSTVGASVGMLWLDIEGTQVLQGNVQLCKFSFLLLVHSFFSIGPDLRLLTSIFCPPWFSVVKNVV